MTGMGEDVYIDHKANREAVLDELVAESQRLGLYGEAPDHFSDASKMVGADRIGGITEMVEEVARTMAIEAGWKKWDTAMHVGDTLSGNDPEDEREGFRHHARAALESLGIPLSVLAAIRAGTWRAVPIEPSLAQCEAGYQVSAIAGSSYHAMVLAATKTPKAAR